MPYGQRNTILIAGLIFASVVLVIYALSAILLLAATGGDLSRLSHHRPQVTSHSWWSTYFEDGGWELVFLFKIIGLFLVLLLCLGAGLVLRRLYQRTASGEIFFFLFFLYSISFEAVWPWNAMLVYRGASVLLTVILSKITYFGRFFGLLALLTSSLYAIEISHHKFSILLLSAFLVSLAFTYVLPVDSSYLTVNLLYRLGDPPSIWLITGVLDLAVVLNFLIAARRRERREFAFAAIGALAASVGRDLHNLGGPAGILLGLLLLAFGIWLFGGRIYRVHLWT